MDYSAQIPVIASSIALASDTIVTFKRPALGEKGTGPAAEEWTTPGLFDFDSGAFVNGQWIKRTVIMISAEREPSEQHTVHALGRKFKVISVRPGGVGAALFYEVEVQGA